MAERDAEVKKLLRDARKTIEKSDSVLNTHKNLEIRRKLQSELLMLLPQGHKSGLNADLLDGFHADDIIKKAILESAQAAYKRGPSGGAPGMQTPTYITRDDETATLPNSIRHVNITEVQKHTPKAHTHNVKTTLSFAVVGNLTVAADQAPTLLAPCALTIQKVKVVVKTAPTGSTIIVDVNKAGTTIFTTQANRPEIPIGGTTDDSGTPDVTALAEGDKLTIDIDQIGSGTPGADLTVEVVCLQEV